MTPARWWLALLAVALLGAAAVVLVNGHQERKVEQAFQQSLELKGQVDALQEQAGKLVGEADEQRKVAAAAGQDVEKSRADVRALKARLAKALASGPGNPVGDVDPVDDTTDLRDQVIAAQGEQIEAQDRQITALGGEIKGLRAALVLKDQALVTQEQRARGLEIALDAQRSAARSGKWVGRLQGFAIGLGAGYVSGRFR